MKKFHLTLISLCLTFFLTSAFAFTHTTSLKRSNHRPDPKEVWRMGIAYSQIKQFYVKSEDDKKIFAGAIRGMLEALDPHSVYLDEEMLSDLKNQAKGDFTGVGIEVTLENRTVKVITPIDGTPAAKAGIKPGDYILAVDDKPILDMPINKVIKLIRGKPGTKVTLTVMNKNQKKPREITILREKIHVNSVRAKMLSDGFAYVRITTFQADTGKKIISAINKLKAENGGQLKGIVLDLRNNPGGLLDTAVEVVDAFLDSEKLSNDKTIVYTKGRIKQAQMRLNAHPGDILHGAPIVVLINQGSASGSEIVAGALQDYKRAVVVGQRSFGKGSVQTLLPLDDKTGIKLTTALYYTPKGRSIQATGIEPDILVENLQVKKDDDRAVFFDKLREAKLTGHLTNGNGKGASKNNYQKAEQIDAATKDYQLHVAQKILKTLTLIKPPIKETAA